MENYRVGLRKSFKDWELSIEDEMSGCEFVNIKLTQDEMVELVMTNTYSVLGQGVLKNLENIGKKREFKRIDFPAGVYSKKKEWIEENTPEGYSYHSESNYGKTANFIIFK